MNGKGRLCKNVNDFSDYLKKKKIKEKYKENSIKPGYAFKQHLDSQEETEEPSDQAL